MQCETRVKGLQHYQRMFGKDYGKAMERLWISMIEREMKERCRQGVKVRGSDKAARTA